VAITLGLVFPFLLVELNLPSQTSRIFLWLQSVIILKYELISVIQENYIIEKQLQRLQLEISMTQKIAKHLFLQ